MEGHPVVLPCTYSHPQHAQHSSLQVLWRHGPGSIVFRCTVRAGATACETGPQQNHRYRLEGDPKKHNLSLRINDATLQDGGHYYCRVEIQGREHKSFGEEAETRLRVEGREDIR